MLTIVILTIFIALLFDFLNGMNDAANSIATIVATRVLSPRAAVAWAAFFNFLAILLFGVPVATTVGKGIVDPGIVTPYLIFSALLGAVVWVYFCTHFGMPISVSHSLIGGLMGAGLVHGGFDALLTSGIMKVLLFILLSPLIGFLLGNFLMSVTLWLAGKRSPQKIDRYFRGFQLFSSAIFSLGHGSNDAQKTMGIIAILLFCAKDYLIGDLGLPAWIYNKDVFYVPFWVVIAAYFAIAMGTLLGGWKVVRTLGSGLTHLAPVHGFSAETAGALTVIGSSLFGIPVSTTHTITGSIIGVGVTRRLSSVKWNKATHIIAAWVFTIPGSLLIGGLSYWISRQFI